MSISMGGGRTPYYKKLMVFIDGTNFLRELGRELDVQFRAEKPPFELITMAKTLILPLCHSEGMVNIRQYWFSSYKGNEEYHDQLAGVLRKNGFEPVLFQRKGDREKGVDIALATEMLVNSFNQNLDIVLLVAGDEDYLGLVKEVKRYGPMVYGAFFRNGLSGKLELALDLFIDLTGRNEAYLRGAARQRLIEQIKAS